MIVLGVCDIDSEFHRMRTCIPAHVVRVLEAGLARVQARIGVGNTQITGAVDGQAG